VVFLRFVFFYFPSKIAKINGCFCRKSKP